MIRTQDLPHLTGRPVHASDGATLGTVDRVFVSDRTGVPRWAYVSAGRLSAVGGFFIPLADATFDGDALRVPYGEDVVRGAPEPEVDGGHLSETEEDRLFRYYGVSEDAVREDRMAGAPAAGVDRTDDAMTRAEERLEIVGTERVEVGRVRVRKYVETEEVTLTVPVRREKVRFEVVTPTGVEEIHPQASAPQGDVRTPTAGTAGAPGTPGAPGPSGTPGTAGNASTDDGWIVLHEEKVSVVKEVVPVERVRVGVERVEEHETVSDEVRKERIDVEGDAHLNLPGDAPAR